MPTAPSTPSSSRLAPPWPNASSSPPLARHDHRALRGAGRRQVDRRPRARHRAAGPGTRSLVADRGGLPPPIALGIGCAASCGVPPWRSPATPRPPLGRSGPSCAPTSRRGAMSRSGRSTGSCSEPRCDGRARPPASTCSTKVSCRSSARSGSPVTRRRPSTSPIPGSRCSRRISSSWSKPSSVSPTCVSRLRPGRESRVEAAGPGSRRELERQAELVEEMLASWTARFGDRVATTVRRIVNGDRPIDPPALVASLHLLHGRTDDYTDDAADRQGVLSETTAPRSDIGLQPTARPERGEAPHHPHMTRRTQWS